MTLETKPKFRTQTRQSELSAPSQPRTRLWASDQLQDQMAGRMGEASLSRKWEFWLWKSASWSSTWKNSNSCDMFDAMPPAGCPSNRPERTLWPTPRLRQEWVTLYFCYKSRNRIKIHSVCFGKFAGFYAYIYMTTLTKTCFNSISYGIIPLTKRWECELWGTREAPQMWLDLARIYSFGSRSTRIRHLASLLEP